MIPLLVCGLPALASRRIGLFNASKRPLSSTSLKETRPSSSMKPEKDNAGNQAVAGTVPLTQPICDGTWEARTNRMGRKIHMVNSESQGHNPESRNKTFIKKRTAELLTSAVITKNVSEFKEYFNVVLVYKSKLFSLRVKMETIHLYDDAREANIIERLIHGACVRISLRQYWSLLGTCQ